MKTAYWINGLGEETSSLVWAEFIDGNGARQIVVRNWRSHDYEVRAADDCITIRTEHWNMPLQDS